jgi:hypothetical protein
MAPGRSLHGASVSLYSSRASLLGSRVSLNGSRVSFNGSRVILGVKDDPPYIDNCFAIIATI